MVWIHPIIGFLLVHAINGEDAPNGLCSTIFVSINLHIIIITLIPCTHSYVWVLTHIRVLPQEDINTIFSVSLSPLVITIKLLSSLIVVIEKLFIIGDSHSINICPMHTVFAAYLSEFGDFQFYYVKAKRKHIYGPGFTLPQATVFPCSICRGVSVH